MKNLNTSFEFSIESSSFETFSKKVFNEVADFWQIERCNGEELYHFAKERADHYGYVLNMGSDGHRIGDFPHHIHFKF